MIPREKETVGGSGGSEAHTILRTFSAPSSLSPHPRRLGVDPVQSVLVCLGLPLVRGSVALAKWALAEGRAGW